MQVFSEERELGETKMRIGNHLHHFITRRMNDSVALVEFLSDVPKHSKVCIAARIILPFKIP